MWYVFYYKKHFQIIIIIIWIFKRLLIKKQTLNIENCFAVDSTCEGVAEGWAISYNGLTWAWASPCSGSCGTADLSQASGYRYATASECANKPSKSDFSTSDSSNTYYYSGVKCAAKIFDANYNHCDANDQLVCANDNSSNELLIVCG